MSIESYPLPVDKLLTLGDCHNFRRWPNYLELGLGPEHIPDLIRLATDEELRWADSENLEVWASVHAWRALGQLHAEAAIEPLMQLFHRVEDDEWALEELPEVYGMIGPAAIPPLTTYLADESHGLYPRITAAYSLERIGNMHPEARAECIAVLSHQLERFAEDDIALNAFLILYLSDLKAVEAIEVIERAYAAGRVDEFVMGDLDDVQVKLGLKAPGEESHKRQPIISQDLISQVFSKAQFAISRQQKTNPKVKAKRKRKQAEKSRRVNQKRK